MATPITYRGFTLGYENHYFRGWVKNPEGRCITVRVGGRGLRFWLATEDSFSSDPLSKEMQRLLEDVADNFERFFRDRDDDVFVLYNNREVRYIRMG